MRTLCIAAALFIAAAPFANANTVLAEGHIAVGAPTSALATGAEAGIENIDSFTFTAAPGTTITTVTVDNSGLGYDLDFYFFDAEGNYIDSGCQTEAADEVCVVPAGAFTSEVAAFSGLDLDVTVVAL